jgi:hypothetical protein
MNREILPLDKFKMLQVLKTLHLMRIYLYFLHISLQILNCIYKKFKNGKIPNSYLPSLCTTLSQ